MKHSFYNMNKKIDNTNLLQQTVKKTEIEVKKNDWRTNELR